MGAVDTNVILRLVLRDDAEQIAIAENAVATGAWLSQVVVAEVMWVVRKHLGHAGSVDAMDMLLGNDKVTWEARYLVADALDMYRSRPAVSFSDCLILATARKAGHLPLATFDKHLAALPGTTHLKR